MYVIRHKTDPNLFVGKIYVDNEDTAYSIVWEKCQVQIFRDQKRAEDVFEQIGLPDTFQVYELTTKE